jgi:hypothetical protein
MTSAKVTRASACPRLFPEAIVAAGDADPVVAEHGDDRRRGALDLASDNAAGLAHADAVQRGPFANGQASVVIVRPSCAELLPLGALLLKPLLPLTLGLGWFAR